MERDMDTSSTDRLSELPDGLLLQILSFLDTRTAVQCSVLGKRWRSLWIEVPVLHLQHLRKDAPGPPEVWRSYYRFVREVLSLRRAGKLTKLSYTDCRTDHRDTPMKSVIHYALSNAAHHLALEVIHHVCPVIVLPDMLDSSPDRNLKTLELKKFQIWKRSRFGGLEVLRTLELTSCYIWCHNGHEDLFSNLPSLENLVLDACFKDGDNVNDSPFDAQKYNRLRISGLHLLSLEISEMVLLNVEVYAPKLKSLLIRNFKKSLKFYELTLPSLERVDIRVYDWEPFVENDKEHWVSFFERLPNIESLTVNDEIVKVLSGFSEFLECRPSPFRRLKNLNVASKHTVYSIPDKVAYYFVKGTCSAELMINNFKE